MAATLELRGYGLSGESTRFRPAPSRFDRRFWIAGFLLTLLALFELLAGSGRFVTYPGISYPVGAEGPLAALTFLLCGFVTWRRGGRGVRR